MRIHRCATMHMQAPSVHNKENVQLSPDRSLQRLGSGDEINLYQAHVYGM